MIDYKEKIKKLLALAESNNEHEAYSALTKARKLMMEHGIRETELGDFSGSDVVVKYSYVYSSGQYKWPISLASVIGSHCRVRNTISNGDLRAKSRIGFIGFADDVDISLEMFSYASEVIEGRVSEIKKAHKGEGRGRVMFYANGYALGFCAGLKESFNRQNAEEGWGLVAVGTPKEVNDWIASKGLSTTKIKQARVSADEYNKGKEDGRNFSVKKKITD